MTPCSADLMNMVEGQNLGVEVADSHNIKCLTIEEVLIKCWMTMERNLQQFSRM
jgi:hypothetical protein